MDRLFHTAQDLELFTCKTREDIGQLVKAGANVDTRHGDETTPLMRHAQNGNHDLTLELLECNAKLDLQDEVCLQCAPNTCRTQTRQEGMMMHGRHAVLSGSCNYFVIQSTQFIWHININIIHSG